VAAKGSRRMDCTMPVSFPSPRAAIPFICF
jgi:hypothetical protein